MDTDSLFLRHSFYADHRIINLGMAARGLYVSLAAWTKQHRKDYTIPRNIPLSFCRASDDNSELLLDQLVEAGLLVEDDNGYCLADNDLFHEVEPVMQQMPATRRQREIGLGPPVQPPARVGKPPASNFDHLAHFDELFALWPATARESKEFALKAYRDTVQCIEDHARVMNGVRGFVEDRKTWSKDWLKKTGFLSNFLIGGKWEKYASKPEVPPVPYVAPPESEVEREERELIQDALKLREKAAKKAAK